MTQPAPRPDMGELFEDLNAAQMRKDRAFPSGWWIIPCFVLGLSVCAAIGFAVML